MQPLVKCGTRGVCTSSAFRACCRFPGFPRTFKVRADMNGDFVLASNKWPTPGDYHVKVESALIDIAERIRDQRPAAKLAFDGFNVQPLDDRPLAYEKLAECAGLPVG